MPDKFLKRVVFEALLQICTVRVLINFSLLSDESMTNFGNHQRKKFSKTFFFGIDLRNFDPSIFTFELVNCFVELPLISQSCNKQLLKKQIC